MFLLTERGHLILVVQLEVDDWLAVFPQQVSADVLATLATWCTLSAHRRTPFPKQHPARKTTERASEVGRLKRTYINSVASGLGNVCDRAFSLWR